MSVTILNHDLLMSENLERMDTVHSNEKYKKKKSSWISIKSKWNRKKKVTNYINICLLQSQFTVYIGGSYSQLLEKDSSRKDTWLNCQT